MNQRSIRPAALRQKPSPRAWRDLFRDEPVFLIGNGPSVVDEDISPIKEYFTIGINRAFMVLDPAVLMWQDINLWNQEKDGVLRSTAVKICRDIADPSGKFFNFRIRTGEGFRLTETPDTLYGTGASGPLAFQLANALGCNPIVLIGYDCKYRPKQTDFYGINRDHQPHTISNCLRGLKWIKEANHGKTVINCSDNPLLGKRLSIIEAINSLQESPKGRQSYVDRLLVTAKKL